MEAILVVCCDSVKEIACTRWRDEAPRQEFRPLSPQTKHRHAACERWVQHMI
jgi:hypothetical protein